MCTYVKSKTGQISKGKVDTSIDTGGEFNTNFLVFHILNTGKQ